MYSTTNIKYERFKTSAWYDTYKHLMKLWRRKKNSTPLHILQYLNVQLQYFSSVQRISYLILYVTLNTASHHTRYQIRYKKNVSLQLNTKYSNVINKKKVHISPKTSLPKLETGNEPYSIAVTCSVVSFVRISICHSKFPFSAHCSNKLYLLKALIYIFIYIYVTTQASSREQQCAAFMLTIYYLRLVLSTFYYNVNMNKFSRIVYEVNASPFLIYFYLLSINEHQ